MGGWFFVVVVKFASCQRITQWILKVEKIVQSIMYVPCKEGAGTFFTLKRAEINFL